MTVKNQYTKAKTVLDALLRGLDPESGHELPRDSVFNNIAVHRAVHAAIGALEQVNARELRRAMLPESVGKNWTPEEEQRLKDAFAVGRPFEDIAQSHKRTVRAIEARLERLGLLRADQRTTRDSFTPADPPTLVGVRKLFTG